MMKHCGSTAQSEPKLIGTWRLLRWYNEYPDGDRFYPLGDDATGYISYTDDGHVFVHIAAADRSFFASTDLFGGMAEENTAAMNSHVTYAGTFKQNGATVTHHVTQASFPNWIGSDQVRHAAREDTMLSLSASRLKMKGTP
ncbi:MAG: lipocalin-like domain-containing protein [Devosiaceae bacterium]